MDKIQLYSGKPGAGKTLLMYMDAVRKRNLKIGIVTFEMHAKTVLNRIDAIVRYFEIPQSEVNITVFEGVLRSEYDLVGRLLEWKKQFDIILIDGLDAYPHIVEGENIERESYIMRQELFRIVHHSIFKNQNRCKELWTTSPSYRSLETQQMTLFNIFKNQYAEIKKHTIKSENGEISAIDFENRSIEIVEVGKILNNK